MDETTLLQRTADRTNELPGASLTHPFGEETDVWKIRGKMFMLHITLKSERLVVLKSAPGDARLLRESFDAITPGYHMNKRHWITVRPHEELDDDFVDDLVTESYLLVVTYLPKKDQPVNPDTFGRLATVEDLPADEEEL